MVEHCTMIVKWLTTVAILSSLSFASYVNAARVLYVTDIGHEDPDVSLADRLAALACQGLMNRKDETETTSIEEDETTEIKRKVTLATLGGEDKAVLAARGL